MIGIFIKWRMGIRIVDSVFKRFCVFSVLCVQVPEFAPGDASWHHWCHHIYIHIEYLSNFHQWTSLYQYSEICRICEYIYIFRQIYWFSVDNQASRFQNWACTYLATCILPKQSGPASFNPLADHYQHMIIMIVVTMIQNHRPPLGEVGDRSAGVVATFLPNSGRALSCARCHTRVGISLGNISCHTFTPHRKSGTSSSEKLLPCPTATQLGHSFASRLSTREYLISWRKYGKTSITVEANLLPYCQNPRFLSSKKLSSKSFSEGILCIFTFVTKHVSFSFRSSRFPFQSPFLEPLCKYVGQGGGERRNYEVKFSLHWVHTGSQLHVWEISQKSLKVEGLISKDFQQARKTR